MELDRKTGVQSYTAGVSVNNNLSAVSVDRVVQVGALHGDLHMHPTAMSGPVPVVTPIVLDGEVFLGRDREVQELLATVRRNSEAHETVTSVIAGMGGVGKTALARRVAGMTVEQFAGGVVLVDMHGYDPVRRIDPVRLFGPLLRALGVTSDEVPSDVGEQAAYYHHFLGNLANQARRVLLVLDNVSSSDQVRDVLPRQQVHRVLVTTRDTLFLPSASVLPLGVLAHTAAVDLLAAVMRDELGEDKRISGHSEHAADIARLCGQLPLAVHIVAGLLFDEPELRLAELVNQLEAARLDTLVYGDQAVAKVFDLSWQHLLFRHPNAAQLLRLMVLNPGPDLSTEAAAALADVSPEVVRSRLRILRQSHLVQHADARWHIHDLVRLHTSQQDPDEDPKAAQQRLFDYYLRVASAADDSLNLAHVAASGDLFTDRDSALAWLDIEHSNLIATVGYAISVGDHSLAFNLAGALASFLSQRRHVLDGVSVSEHAVSAAYHLNSPPHLAAALNNLGLALHSVRRFRQAVTAHRQAAELFRSNGDYCREGIAWNNVCIGMREAEEIDDAIQAGERALYLARKVGDRHSEAFALANLGAAHLQSVGHEQQAVATTQQALALFQEIGDLHAEAKAANQLGLAWLSADPFADVTPEHERAVILHRELGDRHREGGALNNLGNAMLALGKVEAAIQNFRLAVTVFQETGDRYEEAKALSNLGVVLGDVGQCDEARECWVQAVQAFTDSNAHTEAAHIRRRIQEK